jgi:hypothetical protein
MAPMPNAQVLLAPLSAGRSCWRRSLPEGPALGSGRGLAWDECGTWGKNPSIHAGLRQDPRLSKTGVAALGDDLDHGRDQLLAQSRRVAGRSISRRPRAGQCVARKALGHAVDLDPVPHDDALVSLRRPSR